MTDAWTLWNLALAFLAGSVLIHDGVMWIADRLAEQDDEEMNR